VEENITTIQELLGEISSLIKDVDLERESKKEKRQKKLDEEKAAGEEIRGAALSSMKIGHWSLMNTTFYALVESKSTILDSRHGG